jgi:hypothetical protein
LSKTSPGVCVLTITGFVDLDEVVDNDEVRKKISEVRYLRKLTNVSSSETHHSMSKSTPRFSSLPSLTLLSVACFLRESILLNT